MQEALVVAAGMFICSAAAIFFFVWGYEHWDSKLTHLSSFDDLDKMGAFTLGIVMAIVDLYFVVRFIHWAWLTPIPFSGS